MATCDDRPSTPCEGSGGRFLSIHRWRAQGARARRSDHARVETEEAMEDDFDFEPELEFESDALPEGWEQALGDPRVTGGPDEGASMVGVFARALFQAMGQGQRPPLPDDVIVLTVIRSRHELRQTEANALRRLIEQRYDAVCVVIVSGPAPYEPWNQVGTAGANADESPSPA